MRAIIAYNATRLKYFILPLLIVVDCELHRQRCDGVFLKSHNNHPFPLQVFHLFPILTSDFEREQDTPHILRGGERSRDLEYRVHCSILCDLGRTHVMNASHLLRILHCLLICDLGHITPPTRVWALRPRDGFQFSFYRSLRGCQGLTRKFLTIS